MQTILTLGNALNQGTARGRYLHFIAILIFIVLLKYILEDVVGELERLTQELSVFRDYYTAGVFTYRFFPN